MDATLFWRTRDPYGCFSNFSRHPVWFEGRKWPTSEHAYQGMKFLGNTDVESLILAASTARMAAQVGRDRSLPLRPDWDQPAVHLYTGPEYEPVDGIARPATPEPLLARVKDVVMLEVCIAKFRQNADAAAVLLGTGDAPIVEASPVDSYWGWGPDHTGQNKLGRILMAVRSHLRAAENVVT